jgi:hypothetical protein
LLQLLAAETVPLLLLIDDDTSMEMVNDTGQGSFQTVHWALLLLLDLVVQQQTATVLAVGLFLCFRNNRPFYYYPAALLQLLKVWLLFRQRQGIP